MFAANLIGPPRFFLDDRELFFPFRKAQALLCHLLVEERVSRETLSSLLWGGSEDMLASQSLRNALYLLRKGLPDGLVTTCRQWIGVDRTLVDLDLLRLSRLDDVPPEQLPSLCRPLLEGFSLPNAPEFDDWLRTARFQWSGKIRSAFIELARRRMDAAEWEAALHPLNLIASRDEIDEEAYRLIVRVHAVRREWGRAAEAWRVLEGRLKNELGVEPSSESRALLTSLPTRREEQAVAAEEPFSSPRTDSFYGRVTELRGIRDFCGSESATPRCVLVEGEAGVGKSLLVKKALQISFPPDALVLRCAAGTPEATYPLLPWDELLASLFRFVDREALSLPEALRKVLGQSFPSIGGRKTSIQPRNPRRIGAMLAELFGLLAVSRSVVLVFEDFQWFDEPSLDVLEYLLRSAPVNLSLFFTSRTESSFRGASLIRNAARNDRIVFLEIQLSCFPRSDSDAFCAAFLPSRSFAKEELELLFRQTEGLPLFLAELLKAVEKGLPLSEATRHLGDAIEGHLSHIDEEMRFLLEAISIFPLGAEWTLVRRIAGLSAARLASLAEGLRRRGVLAESRGEGESLLLEFRHGKVREHVYSFMSEGRRRLLHEQAARLLMDDFSVRPWDDLACSRIIHHCRRGALRIEELEYMIRRLKYHIKLNYELFPLLDDHILKACAASLDNRSSTVEDLETTRELLRAVRKEKDGATPRFAALERAYFALRGGYSLWWGDYDQGKALVEEGLARAAETEDLPLQADCLQHLCYYAIQREDGDLLRSASNRLAEAADRCGDAPLAAMARRFFGMSLLFLGEFEGAEEALRESVALFRRMEYMDSPYTLQVLAGDCYLGEIRLRTGRTKEALDIFSRCVDECEEHGLYRGLCLFCSNAALAAFDLGEEKTAREYLLKARHYFEGSELRRANAIGLALLALFAAREGREDEAVSFWESAGKLCRSLRKKSWIDVCRRIRTFLEKELDPASPLKQRLRNSPGDGISSICEIFEELCREI